MEYRPLGNTGMKVSHMSLGSVAFGNMYDDMSVDEAIRVVDTALKEGVNYIDTAPWYGNTRAERILGLALDAVPRDKFYISTKVGRYSPEITSMFDFSAERTLASVDESLARLGLKYVDIIQVHDVEFSADIDIILNETLPALQKVKDAGKAKFIGITGYSFDVLKEIVERSTVQIDTVLSYCCLCLHDTSLLDQLEFFKTKGVGVINASPIAMRLFTQDGPPLWHPARQSLKEACSNAAKLCQDRDVNLSRLAISYTYSYRNVPTTLVSMSKVTYLMDNLNIIRKGLTDKEVQVREEIMDRYLRPLGNSSWEGIELEKYRNKLAKSREMDLTLLKT